MNALNQKDQEPCIKIGEILARPARNELSAHGKTQRVQPKVMAVLLYLAEQQPHVVSNDELLEKVWAGRVVTYSSVQKSINFLRKAIAALVGENEYITHFSKKGYQLTVKVEHWDEALVTEPVGASGSGGPYQANTLAKHSRKKWLVHSCILLTLLVLLISVWQQRHKFVLLTHHLPTFTQLESVTQSQGLPTSLAAHPSESLLAIVRTLDGVSELVVTDLNGDSWRVAASEYQWSMPVWSADGGSLAVIETHAVSGEAAKGRPVNRADNIVTLHIFLLDTKRKLLLDKHRLSQWHGEIFSLTWRDLDEIEFVARQGTADTRQRYRFDIGDQNLSQIAPLEYAPNPMISKVYKQYTALLSRHGNRLRLDFIYKDTERFQSVDLKAHWHNIQWLSDGSGVLLEGHNGQWLLVYRDGTQRTIVTPPGLTDDRFCASYAADGKSLYFIQAEPMQTLSLAMAGDSVELSEHNDSKGAAIFAADGRSLVYVEYVDQQYYLLWQSSDPSGTVKTLYTTPSRIESLAWGAEDDTLVFRAADNVYSLDLKSGAAMQLFATEESLELVSLNNNGSSLLVVRDYSGVRNLWKYNRLTSQWQQLTFGEVADVVVEAQKSEVYFQYLGQSGLWRLLNDEVAPAAGMEYLPPNSDLLSVQGDNIYYSEGGQCRDHQVLEGVLGGQVAPVLADDLGLVGNLISYHPQTGWLYSPCVKARSDVLRLLP